MTGIGGIPQETPFQGNPDTSKSFRGSERLFNLKFRLKRVLAVIGCVKMVAPWQ